MVDAGENKDEAATKVLDAKENVVNSKPETDAKEAEKQAIEDEAYKLKESLKEKARAAREATKGTKSKLEKSEADKETNEEER